MALKLKLISENPEVFDNFEYLEEQSNRSAPSTLYVKGPFLGAETINKNKRLYKIDEMRTEVNRYIKEMVNENRAMGELNHPATADVDLTKACHLVTELYEEDNTFYGKSKVLSGPMGQILRSLINDGVKVGMSSRALGTLEEGAGHSVVRNMHLVAIDAVADPSFPKAFVNGILESKSYVLDQDGSFEEIYDNFNKSLRTLPKHETDHYLREQILKFINSLHIR